MVANSDSIICDGCGLLASTEHIAARVERLELATRFRPIHIHVLFVALAPMPRLEDDFYRSPESSEFFSALLSSFPALTDAGPKTGNDADALRVGSAEINSRIEFNAVEAGAAKLLEFQRRGHYLTYLSECPLTRRNSAIFGGQESVASEWISLLASTLVKRVRFNYKPKHIALLGPDLAPLIEVFEQAGVGPLLRPKQATDYTFSPRALPEA